MEERKYLFIDFEFNDTTERDLNLVCVAFRTSDNYSHRKTYWFNNNKRSYASVAKVLQHFIDKGYIFVAYSVMAEARSLLTLGIDPRTITWIDLYLEHKVLINHFNQHRCGKQLVNGEVVNCRPPKNKWEEDDEEGKGYKVTANLSSACYHFLGRKIDTVRKTEMRNLIISKPKKYSYEQEQEILNYCEDDVAYLMPLMFKMRTALRNILTGEDRENMEQYMYERGRWAVANAIIERLGYPISYTATKNFSDSVPDIVTDLQSDINSQFPKEIQPFRYKKKTDNYSMNQKNVMKWIEEESGKEWMMTPTNRYSLSLDAFIKHYPYTHDYPRNNYGAQMVRYFKTKQSLNGFSSNVDGKRKTFWDSVGKDRRCRPYLNIYGSQTGRNQPSATGFLFLKAAWMRALCSPPRGRSIVGIDFGSEEFLIAALVSKDKNMVKAYESGDVYLYFAKEAGAVPPDATKKSHGRERDIFKTVVLATQYKMTSTGLAKTLTEKMGEEFTKEDAQEFLDKFEEAFPVFADWSEDILDEYEEKGYLILRSGWMIGPDNPNFRSVGNFPIQGAGSDILRYSVYRAQAQNLDVILTLHDALYVECDNDKVEETIKILANSMREGFKDYFRGTDMESLANVRLDGKVWGSKYSMKKITREIDGTPMTFQKLHIDSRALPDYEKFSKYFKSRNSDLSKV